MDFENLSAEEVYQRISIQGNLIDLQSDDREKVKIALNSLAAVSTMGLRKDSLFALAGYYA